jgi:hypothetical protein
MKEERPMNSDPMIEALRRVEVPGIAEARARAIAAARDAYGSGPTPSPRRLRRLARRRIAIALTCLAIAAAFLAFTGPGQAATAWVSDLISGPNEFLPGSSGYYIHNSQLIGYGALPTGEPYQLRAVANHDQGDACIQLIWKSSDISKDDPLGGALCDDGSVGESRWSRGDVEALIDSLPNDSPPGASGTVVLGVAPPQASEVLIRVPASPDVQPSEESTQTFGLRGGEINETSGESVHIPPLTAFVGYLPPGAGDLRTAPASEAIALDGNGSEISATNLAWVRFVRPDIHQPAIMPCLPKTHFCDLIIAGDRGGSQSGRAEP